MLRGRHAVGQNRENTRDVIKTVLVTESIRLYNIYITYLSETSIKKNSSKKNEKVRLKIHIKFVYRLYAKDTLVNF